MPRRHLVVDPRDNVTTLLDDRLDDPTLDGGGPVDAGVPFGHKVAISPIRNGDPVVKYGIAIGVSTTDIPRGAHVHVHNCR